jgi:predicted transcriptional regulator
MTNQPSLPRDVARFLDSYVDSITRLEILLLLFREARRWRVDEIAQELRTTEDHVSTELGALTRAKLVTRNDDAFVITDDRATRAVLDSVSSVYATYRVAVTTHVFSKPSESIRGFSDAFRFRKED